MARVDMETTNRYVTRVQYSSLARFSHPTLIEKLHVGELGLDLARRLHFPDLTVTMM